MPARASSRSAAGGEVQASRATLAVGSQSKAIGDQLRKAAATIVKATVLEIDANLRASPDEGGTPVDTGNARSNWIPSIGSPHDGEVSGDGGHAAGVAAVAGYQLQAGPVFVSNAAPYIDALNRGSSTQAPAMFIESAVDKALATMQGRFGNAAISVDKFRDDVGSAGAENLASAYSPFGDD